MTMLRNRCYLNYFSLPHHRTIIRGKSIAIRGAKLWEEIPEQLQNIGVFLKFKHELQVYFISKYITN